MKKILSTLMVAMALFINNVPAQAQMQFPAREFTPQEQQFLDLSDSKWQWMAQKNVEELKKLFHDSAMFVHMGGSWGKDAELTTIEKGFIWYKHADIHSREVKQAGDITIVYSNIHLTSQVGGHEVRFPFMVTEVFVPGANGPQLASLVFTKLATPEDNH